MEDNWGETSFKDQSIIITLRTGGMQDGLVYDTLLHEWAHAITYPFYTRNQDPHDEVFWITFGKIYRRWHDEGGAEASRGL